jgi:hypothetical protein
VEAHYTVHHLHRCACSKTHGHPRWGVLNLSVWNTELVEGLPSIDAPQSTSARIGELAPPTPNFKVMRASSSLDVEKHSDCAFGAAFVKSPTNSLDVAGSVGRSAPTDPDRFLVARHFATRSQRTKVSLGPSCQRGGPRARRCEAPGAEYYTHEGNARSSDNGCISANLCCHESAGRSRHTRGPWPRHLPHPVVAVDDAAE